MEDGVWRTIRGHRVFIKNKQSVKDAIKESGKFEKASDISRNELKNIEAELSEDEQLKQDRTMDPVQDKYTRDLEGKHIEQPEATKEYKSNFLLEAEVNDFDAAQQYLTSDDMSQYLPKELQDVVTSVDWTLDDESSGHVSVKTTRDLTDSEKTQLQDWIDGQNSDGLGEGFEQQKFAETYYNPYTGDGPYTYREAEQEITDMFDRMDPSDYSDYLDETMVEDAIDTYIADAGYDSNDEEARENARADILDNPEEYLDWETIDNAKNDAIQGNDEYNIDSWYNMSSMRRNGDSFEETDLKPATTEETNNKLTKEDVNDSWNQLYNNDKYAEDAIYEAQYDLQEKFKAFDKGDISSAELEQAKKDSGLTKEQIEEARNYVNDRAPESYPKQTENKSGNTTSQPVPNGESKRELDDNNYHLDKEERKKDYEHDLQWFEDMEKQHPSKEGLANNEEYQALKQDYESEFGEYKSSGKIDTKDFQQWINDNSDENIKKYEKETGKDALHPNGDPTRDFNDYEYNLYKQAKENPDSINPMTEWSTDWEALDEKYKDRYNKERDKNYQDYMAGKKDWDGYEKGIKEARDRYEKEKSSSSNEDNISKELFNEASKIDDPLDRAIQMQVADDVGKVLTDDSIRFRAENYIRNNYNGNATDDEIYEKLKSAYKNNGSYQETNNDGRSFGDKFMQKAKNLDDRDKGKISEEEYFNRNAEIEGQDPEKEKERVKGNLDRLGVERPEFLQERDTGSAYAKPGKRWEVLEKDKSAYGKDIYKVRDEEGNVQWKDAKDFETSNNEKGTNVKQGSPVEDLINKEGINVGGRLREVDNEAKEYFRMLNSKNLNDDDLKNWLHSRYPESNKDTLFDKYNEFIEQEKSSNNKKETGYDANKVAKYNEENKKLFDKYDKEEISHKEYNKKSDELKEKHLNNNDWIKDAYKKYLKEHPKSKISLSDFMKKNK